ncbi:MAG TPA: fluoride efflux transporter CrcB [Verrucomicrobiota bacterium]|nr:fluoride efflux transporter CrcB [Verrucomicrobiota bacterium]
MILLFLGGGLGTIIRWGISGLIATKIGEIFPFGTIFVNITGSFAIGFIATLTSSDGRIFLHSDIRQFLMFGVLGGYTTFSSFSLQTLNLIKDNEIFLACANVIISVILCLLAVWLGHIMASKINSLNWF